MTRNPLSSILRDAWTPADRREPWRWCEDHIKSIPYSPLPGPFRSENSPWIREVMEAIVDPKKDRKLEKSLSNHSDSSLAKIGGGGLLAARYDITAKQLSESKRQSKLLQKIAENTERQSGKSELLMK